jgi:hypothetical protein
MKRVVLRMPPEMIRELDELRDHIARENGPLHTVRERLAREAGEADADGTPPHDPAHGSRAAAARVLLALGMAVFRERAERRG